MMQSRFWKPCEAYLTYPWLMLLATGITLVSPVLSQNNESTDGNIDLATVEELRAQA